MRAAAAVSALGLTVTLGTERRVLRHIVNPARDLACQRFLRADPKDAFPTAAVYGDTDAAELRLITCAGVWDSEVRSHRDNTVVYATLISDT